MSYSTPTALQARIGTRLYVELTAESGDTADDTTAQGFLDAASIEINIRIGNRYAVPVASPPDVIANIAGIEEQIALWFAWVHRGIGDQESAASAAKVGYDASMEWLKTIAEGKMDLPGAALRTPPTSAESGLGWQSNPVVYTRERVRSF